MKEYIHVHHPDALLLENVPGLGHVVVDLPDTDAAYIVKELKSLGYPTVVQFLTQATRYGSSTSRARLYWLALLSDQLGLDHLLSSIVDQLKFKDTERERLSTYLLSSADRELASSPPGDEMLGGRFDEMKYKTEHLTAFDDARLTWPAPRDGASALEQCLHLDQRSYEVAYLAHHAFPYKPDSKGNFPYEFMDCATVCALEPSESVPIDLYLCSLVREFALFVEGRLKISRGGRLVQVCTESAHPGSFRLWVSTQFCFPTIDPRFIKSCSWDVDTGVSV